MFFQKILYFHSGYIFCDDRYRWAHQTNCEGSKALSGNKLRHPDLQAVWEENTASFISTAGKELSEAALEDLHHSLDEVIPVMSGLRMNCTNGMMCL